MASNGENLQQRVMVQRLLSEIYSRYHSQKQLDSSTETSCLSDGIHGIAADAGSLLKQEQNKNLQVSFLKAREINELKAIKQDIDKRISVMSTKLVRQLKQRNRLRDKNKRYCDTVTAVLQAVSKKRKVDAKLQFNMEPPEGEEGFNQWCDALRAIVRLPGGLPSCWRKRIWIYLADHYLNTKHTKPSQIVNRVFSDRICPADESLGNQIVKDLHRTGYTNVSLSEESSIEDRLVLKRVLLAYARWNQGVGYCQGFNVLAALILQVTEGNEEAAFKIMVFLVDGVLPENYFANNLQALSVDMAVFRDLLKARLPQLSKHLEILQKEANEASKGSNYEPPLTNVFTMQWFLTLFATCLPFDAVLRIWDSVLLDGNEILLRIALAIWAKLGEKIGETHSADEFYCNMSTLMQKALNGKLINTDELIRLSYRVAAFPFPHLKELREKYTYNITPFAAESGEELKDEELSPSHRASDGIRSHAVSQYEDEPPFFCFTGFVSNVPTPTSAYDKKKSNKQSLEHASSRDQFAANYQVQRGSSMMAERMSTDIASLKNQYMSIRSRQLKAHLVYAKPVSVNNTKKSVRRDISPKVQIPVMVNHLLIGRNDAKVQSLSMTPLKIKDRQSSAKKSKASSKATKSTLSASFPLKEPHPMQSFNATSTSPPSKSSSEKGFNLL